MILAFTGAGISQASGVPTFAEQPGIRDCLTRSYAIQHPAEYGRVITDMKKACDAAVPSDAHIALAEYDVPVITMNVGGYIRRPGAATSWLSTALCQTLCFMMTRHRCTRWLITGYSSYGRGIFS